MRADELTRNQDEKYGHFSLDTSKSSDSDGQSSFYRGSKLGSDRGRKEAGLGRGQSEVDNEVLRSRENEGNFVKRIDPPVMHGGKPAQLWQLLTSKKARGKSSLFVVLVLLFGGGGFLSTLLAPSAAILQLKEVFTSSLNDQLKAMDNESAKIMKAKFKATTTGSCGVVKIKCQFAEMTDAQAKEFEARSNNRIKINLVDIGDGEGKKIGNMVYTEDGKKPITIDDPKQFSTLLKDNDGFRSTWSTVYNLAYEGTSDPKAREVIRDKEKASKNVALTGEDDEERQKKLNSVVTNGESVDAKTLTKKTDKDGNTTYTDEAGHTYTQAQYDDIVKSGNTIGDIVEAGGQNGLISRAAKIVGITGAVDNVCTVWNTMRHVSSMAKIIKKQQAIRFALALVLTMADKIKSGDAKEEEVNFAGNNIMTEQPSKKVIDDSKLNQASNGTIPETDDPEAGGSGLNAPSYNAAAYGDVPTLSSRAEKFSLSAGSVAILDSIITGVATAVNAGNPNPKEVSKKCGYVQNNFVRIGSLGIGIVAGVATFGLWQIAGTTASVAFSLAQPSLEAAAGDMVAGNVFKDIYGMDSVDATYVGTASVLGDIGEARGMLPVNNDEGVQYIEGNSQTLQTYIKDQQYLARATPFDISNRYSFLGSMLFSATPTLLTSQSNMSTAMMNIASMIPTTFAHISQPVGAAAVNSKYFESCADSTYQAMGIKAGLFCVVRHYWPQNSANLDPLENAQWMADTGNIDPDSDTGAATDNGQSWNYVKYLAECTNRSAGWGENQEENSGDGSECLSAENEPLNMHFRAYTMHLSINSGMRDGNTNTGKTKDTGDVAATNKSPVGPNGWAFPANSDQTVVRGFGGDHKGVDLAAGSIERTNLQPIYAARGGTVVSTGKQKGYGNWVVIRHDNVDGKTLYSVYSNIDDDQILVDVGQEVAAGDMIAKIGSSNEMNGPHLHFEIWDGQPLAGGTPIDPTAIIEGSKVKSTTVGGSV